MSLYFSRHMYYFQPQSRRDGAGVLMRQGGVNVDTAVCEIARLRNELV